MDPQDISGFVLLNTLTSHNQNTSGSPMLPYLEALRLHFLIVFFEVSIKTYFENYFKRGLYSTQVDKVMSIFSLLRN